MSKTIYKKVVRKYSVPSVFYRMEFIKFPVDLLKMYGIEINEWNLAKKYPRYARFLYGILICRIPVRPIYFPWNIDGIQFARFYSMEYVYFRIPFHRTEPYS